MARKHPTYLKMKRTALVLSVGDKVLVRRVARSARSRGRHDATFAVSLSSGPAIVDLYDNYPDHFFVYQHGVGHKMPFAIPAKRGGKKLATRKTKNPSPKAPSKKTENPAPRSAPKRARKIGKRARNHVALSERYTLSSLPDSEVARVTPGDTYFAVRGGGNLLGVVRSNRVVGWIDVGRLHHLSARAWMTHVGQATRRR
jgi:hypothetical protein